LRSLGGGPIDDDLRVSGGRPKQVFDDLRGASLQRPLLGPTIHAHLFLVWGGFIGFFFFGGALIVGLRYFKIKNSKNCLPGSRPFISRRFKKSLGFWVVETHRAAITR
jgi:hypothetical protein